MSHSIEYYQNMSTRQLLHEMNHAEWTVDRNRAREVYEARMAQEKKQQAANAAAVARLSQSIDNMNRQINDLHVTNNSLRTVIDDQNRRLTALQHTNEQQIAQIRTDYTRALERTQEQNRRAMTDMQNRFEADLTRSEAQLRSEMNDAIQESEGRTGEMIHQAAAALNERITAVHDELDAQLSQQQAQIRNLEEAWNSLHHDNAQLEQQAEEYRNAGLAVLNAAIAYNNENRHNWRSADLQQLRQRLQDIDSDLALHHMLTVGATRAAARDFFEAALAYRANVCADEQEWQLRQAATLQQLGESMIDLNAAGHLDLDGMDIDVDYWTCGDLKRIGQQLAALQHLAQQPALSVRDLESIGALAETYRQEIAEAVRFAVKARQFSFDRKDLLETAVDHIERRFGNLRPVWEEYFAGDERLGYRVYLTSPSGERIVLTAEPVTAPGADNSIRNSFRYDILSLGSSIHNAGEARTFMQDLENTLQDIDGCTFSTSNCTNTAAPAPDQGQSDSNIWKTPAPAAVRQATDRAARQTVNPGAELPTPAPFVPQAQL